MSILNQKLILFITILVVVPLISSITLISVFKPPEGEKFSEIYLLGPNHKATDYPSNIVPGKNYLVTLGVANHLGASASYVLYIKFGNDDDRIQPGGITSTPSTLQSLEQYTVHIDDNEKWEVLLVFSVSNITKSDNTATIKVLTINGQLYDVDKSAAKETNHSTFRYHLIAELWIHDPNTDDVVFNNRYIDLVLNL